MLVPIDQIVGGDEEDTKLLRQLAVEARDYATSFKWCLPITNMQFADGVGGIIAIFLFEFDGKIGGTDDSLWIVVGDLPSAYMVVEPDDSAKEALERYCELMDDWAEAVLGGGDLSKVFPVRAPATKENAESLRRRLDLLRKNIIPDAPAEFIN